MLHRGTKLETMLCDQIACEITDSSIQKELLAKKGLTFEWAYDIAEDLAEATENVKMWTPGTHWLWSTAKVWEAEIKEKPWELSPRTWESRFWYLRETSPQIWRHQQEQLCRVCELKGHIVWVCWSKPKARSHTWADTRGVDKLDRYPVPKVEDLFATLRNSKLSTKLDLRQAFQQLLLDNESKKYVVINTTKGLFRYTRLPYYGISSAPGIFQREIEHFAARNSRCSSLPY